MKSRKVETFVVSPSWGSHLAANGWASLDDLFALINNQALSKPGLPPWRERLGVTVQTYDHRPMEVYVKRFQKVPFWEQVKRWWGGNRRHGTAWTEWYWLGRLAEAGIPAPEPIAYGEEMVWWWERRSAVVMAAVPGQSLERWCADHDGPLPEGVPGLVAELVARFHALGVAHRDLYLSHIFGEGLSTPTPRLFLIDLQRVWRLGRWRRRWIVKDLAALNHSTPATVASPRERLRWLKRYLHLHEAGPCKSRAEEHGPFRLRRRDRILVRLIVGRTEQMRRHDARRRAKT